MKKKSTLVIALLVSALAGGICFYVIGGASPLGGGLDAADNQPELTAENASGEGLRLIGKGGNAPGSVGPGSVSEGAYGNKAKQTSRPSSASSDKPSHSSGSSSVDQESSAAAIDAKNEDAQVDSQEIGSKSDSQINQEKFASGPAAETFSFGGPYMAGVHHGTNGAGGNGGGAVVLPSSPGSNSQPNLNSQPAPDSQQTPGSVPSNDPLWPSSDPSGGGSNDDRNDGLGDDRNEWFADTQPTHNVPEPGVLLLFSTGLLGMAVANRSRRKRIR